MRLRRRGGSSAPHARSGTGAAASAGSWPGSRWEGSCAGPARPPRLRIARGELGLGDRWQGDPAAPMSEAQGCPDPPGVGRVASGPPSGLWSNGDQQPPHNPGPPNPALAHFMRGVLAGERKVTRSRDTAPSAQGGSQAQSPGLAAPRGWASLAGHPLWPLARAHAVPSQGHSACCALPPRGQSARAESLPRAPASGQPPSCSPVCV